MATLSRLRNLEAVAEEATAPAEVEVEVAAPKEGVRPQSVAGSALEDISPQITQELKATGVARVIVVLRAVAEASRSAAAAVVRGSDESALDSYFTTSDLSQSSALLRSGAARITGGAGASLRLSTRASTRSAAAASARTMISAPVQRFPNLGVMLGTVTPEGLNGVISDGRVASVTGAPQFSLIAPERIEPAKLTTTATWGLDFLRVPALWKQGLSGKGIRVGHLDTGVDAGHPALKKAVAQFAELDFLGQLKTPSPDPFDSDEHGTHTAGTIAGRAVQGKNIGVAPEADLCSAVVIEGGEVIARVLGGMDWALEHGVRVLSLSLGLRGWWEDLIPIVHILRARNVLPVIAVGNEGPGTSRSPGNYPEALSVGAVDQQGKVAPFSSSQRFLRSEDPVVPDVVAPGVNVISAQPKNRYQAMDGSSMATPHVAGLAALLCEAKPSATVAEVEEAIFGSCSLRGIAPDRGNHGIPDAVEALRKLTGVNALATVKAASGAKVRAKARVKTKKKAANKGRPVKKAAKKK